MENTNQENEAESLNQRIQQIEEYLGQQRVVSTTMYRKVVHDQGNASGSGRVEQKNPKPVPASNEKKLGIPWEEDQISGETGESRSIREPEHHNRSRLQTTSQTSSRAKSSECSGLNEKPRSQEWIPTGLLRYAITCSSSDLI